jgi:cytoskeletal protein CcmA (bactofilin family)
MVLWKPDNKEAPANTGLDSARGAPPPPALKTPPTPPSIAPSRASQAVRSADRGSASMIGADLTVIGNLVSKGEVQVDGEIQGDIHGTSIIIGERARITGAVVAEDVIVRGQINGSIRGHRVTLQSSSRVEGDIYHQSLAIEQGAFFEGKSRRSDDPIAGIVTPTVSRAEDAEASSAAAG